MLALSPKKMLPRTLTPCARACMFVLLPGCDFTTFKRVSWSSRRHRSPTAIQLALKVRISIGFKSHLLVVLFSFLRPRARAPNCILRIFVCRVFMQSIMSMPITLQSCTAPSQPLRQLTSYSTNLWQRAIVLRVAHTTE